jgi:hypothetical protein
MQALRAVVLSALLLTMSATATFASSDATSVRDGDGGGYALPSRPSLETARDGDGGGYTVPTVPGDRSDSERWL